MIADLNQSSVLLQIVAIDDSGAQKTNVSSGSVVVYRMVSGAKVEFMPSASLVQEGTTNIWKLIWNPASLPVGEYVAEYTIEDDDGIVSGVAEDIIVRDIATQSSLSLIGSDMEIVKKVETGRWRILGNQMIFYDTDGATPILTFDLLDESGSPTNENVFERRLA